MITIRYLIIGIFLSFLFIYGGGVFFINTAQTYNDSNLSPSVDGENIQFINNINESISRGQSDTSLVGLTEGVDSKIRSDEGINLLKTGLEIGKLLTDIPEIMLNLITTIGTFIGIPEWVSLIFISIGVLVVVLSVAAALLRWYI